MLKSFREEIDNVDKEIVRLFEKRMKLVSEVAKYKKENNIEVYSKNRESEVIEKVLSYLDDREFDIYLIELYLDIMNISKNYQNDKIND